MIKITRINHTAINGEDAAAMQAFYTQHLNVQTVERDLPDEIKEIIPGFWMQFENGQVHMIQNSDRTPGNPLGPHIAFYVEDLDAAEQYLISEGIEHARLDFFIFLTDPAGNTVELQQDPLSGNS